MENQVKKNMDNEMERVMSIWFLLVAILLGALTRNLDAKTHRAAERPGDPQP